eukprot:c9697_g1_i5.p2 GENE.c9697_g1_i5~~c9697_g1_i5.p2  ORF type:complete len:114 (-),score=8.13 c9697_g1_i5:780-1121(-)
MDFFWQRMSPSGTAIRHDGLVPPREKVNTKRPGKNHNRTSTIFSSPSQPLTVTTTCSDSSHFFSLSPTLSLLSLTRVQRHDATQEIEFRLQCDWPLIIPRTSGLYHTSCSILT